MLDSISQATKGLYGRAIQTSESARYLEVKGRVGIAELGGASVGKDADAEEAFDARVLRRCIP